MTDKREMELFKSLIDENRYNFCKLVYIIFPFGEEGSELERMRPYKWQMEEWARLSKHLNNPETRHETYRLIISSGNGAAKTAFGAMTTIMLLYSQKLKARVTANTDTQLSQIIWPEYEKWFRLARYVDQLFEKFGTTIKAKNRKFADNWKVDRFTWNEENPSAVSGLHNKGHACMYVFEEAPGIPANIWDYASGAFTETETIKVHLAFGNSDDPESKFEQNMTSPLWRSRRIDTRTLDHIDPKQVEDWLLEAGGDEDNDDFRVRVRGLPRKTSRDSIIRLETVEAALERRKNFDKDTVKDFPVVLSCDPAWTGGDETVIWYKQGHYYCMLEKYKLEKARGDTHKLTYNKLVYWEKKLKADAVHIDQGEGTAIYSYAMDAEKFHWVLVSFASSPTDHIDPKQSEYHNIRAMMFYEFQKLLMKGAVLDAMDEKWIEDIRKQLTWTKGSRHKITYKKLAESKLDIKARVGRSPDVADGAVLTIAYSVIEKLPENEDYGEDETGTYKKGGPYKMPNHEVDYNYEYTNLYN